MNSDFIPSGIKPPSPKVKCAHRGCERSGYKQKNTYYCPDHKRSSRVLKDEDKRLLDLLKD